MAFDLGTIFAEIGISTQKLDAGLMQASTKLAAADKSITGFGQKLTASSTKLLATGGLMAGSVIAVGVAAVKMASVFETSMRNVNSISKLSETEFKALGESVIGISKKFPQTAKELADGLYDIASSGFQGAAGLKVLEASAAAASAGLTNTATSAKGITAVLNAYSLGAEDAAGVSDTMFRTVDKGVISFEELSGQIGEVVGTANIAGIGFNELSGMIAYMTTKGINAAEATTALNRMMLSIITPTEELAAVLKNAGYESGQMALEQIGLTGVMELIEKAANGDVAAINAMSGDMRAFKAVASLTGSGIEELNKFMGDFKDTTGSTSIALKEQSKALGFQLNILKNNATALGIELGNKLIPYISGLVKGLNDLSPAQKDAIYNTIEITLKLIAAGSAVLLLAGAFGKLRMAMLANPYMAAAAAVIAINVAADTGAKKLAELDSVWAKIGETWLRVIAPLTLVKKGLTDNITLIGAIRDGTIAEIDTTNLNIFTIGEHVKKLQALRAEKEKDSEITILQGETTAQFISKMYELDGVTSSTIAAEKALTQANNEETKSIDDMRGAYNELIGVLFDSINTSNAFQEAGWALKDAQDAVTEAVKKYGVGSREAETAINGLDAASQTYIDTAYGVYTAVDATKEEQEAARLKAIEYGLQMMETGEWGEGAFISMASQFGMSAKDIIDWADKEGKEIDYATRLRFMGLDITTLVNSSRTAQENIDSVHGATVNINADINDVTSKIGHVASMLSEINGRTSTVYIDTVSRKIYAMGGIVGYANGGVVMPQAASGMVVPQTGRAYPIMAHEYEDILNTSQQKNIAEWIMGKANSRPDSKSSSSNEVILHTIINLDGKVLWESNEKYDIRAAGVRV